MRLKLIAKSSPNYKTTEVAKDMTWIIQSRLGDGMALRQQILLIRQKNIECRCKDKIARQYNFTRIRCNKRFSVHVKKRVTFDVQIIARSSRFFKTISFSSSECWLAPIFFKGNIVEGWGLQTWQIDSCIYFRIARWWVVYALNSVFLEALTEYFVFQ